MRGGQPTVASDRAIALEIGGLTRLWLVLWQRLFLAARRLMRESLFRTALTSWMRV